MFMMDDANRQRIKIWGTAKVVEDDDALRQQLTQADYRARVEQVILFAVTAWDVNCPQHIPQMFEAKAVEEALAEKDRRIAEFEREIRASGPQAPEKGRPGFPARPRLNHIPLLTPLHSGCP